MKTSETGFTSSPKGRRALIALGVGFIATLIVAGCGGSDDATPAPTPPLDKDNATVPVNANTTNASAPFYVDLTGLDLSTQPPTRTAKAPSYPAGATVLASGKLPALSSTGNFIADATRSDAPETVEQPGVPKGREVTFTMNSADSTIYNPGWVRDEASQNSTVYSSQVVPGDPSNLVMTNSHAGPWTRTVTVYIPAGYVAGTDAPFMVANDGGLWSFLTKINTVLDNLIFQKRIPPIILIQIAAGGQDAQGSERGREYDTVDGAYAEFVQQEVLPLVEQNAGVKLTADPEGRATLGISSGFAAAFTMAWFHPEWYHRVVGYSPTLTNQQWPHNPALPGGAWQYHSPYAGTKAGETATTPLILAQPKKPIRVWFTDGDQDAYYPQGYMADGMHDWTLSSHNFAKALSTMGYEYQWMFTLNSQHFDIPHILQTLPYAIEWTWQGYPIP